MHDLLAGKRVLVTGVSGQVGKALKTTLSGRCELVTSARQGADIDLDLTNIDQIKKAIDEVAPDIVINPAAYTQVDKAEDELELAKAINAKAPEVIADLCKKHSALLVHYSTDYVFSGESNKPYSEDEPTSPINVYGQTKLEGEQAIQSIDCDHLIFRTCWVYDADGQNFLNAILNRARTMAVLKVVNDQLGTPTWAGFIADITCKVLNQSLDNGAHCSGGNRIYNLKPEGMCSWYDFAAAIITYAKEREKLAVQELVPVSSDAFPTKAARPSWSVLDNKKLMDDFELTIQNWEKYTATCLMQKYFCFKD